MSDSFDWNVLRSFLAVARLGRLTTAAQQLRVDHSTLGRRIKALEASLGAQLFRRSVSGYALTTQGERLLAAAESMESTALTMLRDVGDASLPLAGTVRIGAPDGFGTQFLAPRLGRICDRHPALEVQLLTLPRLVSPTKREADMAIVLAQPSEGRLHARKLTDYELGLYASSEYLATHAPLHQLEDLKKHRLVGYIEDLIYAPELDYLTLLSPMLRPSLTCSNLVAQMEAAVAGVGLCILPCFMAVRQPGLRRALAGEVALTRSFWLIVHSSLRELPRVRVTADFIADEVKAVQELFLPRNGGASPSARTSGNL